MKVASLEIDLLANIARLQGDMNKAQGAVQKSMANIERNVQRVQRAFGALGLGVGFGAFISQATKMADAWQGLENRLRLVTKGQTELAAATNAVFSISQRTSQEIDSTAQVYQRFAQNANALGLSQQKVAALTETVGKAIAISGGSAASAQGALMQFGQALASGVLRGEEFNSVMEGAPGLAQALATGLGVPVGSLRALAAQGKITGDVIVDSLTKAAGAVDEQFGTRIKTVGQAFTELNNAVTKYVGQMAQATGASSTFANVVGTLAENVEGIARALMFLAATAIPAAVRALWSLTAAMTAVPGMALVKVLSVAAGAALAFGDRLSWLTDLTDGLGLAWVAAVRLWEKSIENIKSFLGVLGSGTQDLFLFITQGSGDAATSFKDVFQSAFLAVGGLMDDVYEGFTGNLSALVSVFVTTGQNIHAALKWGFDSAAAAFSQLMFDIKDGLNGLGAPFGLTLPTESPGALQLKSITDEAKKAYEAGRDVLGMRDALVKAIAKSTLDDLSDAFDVPLVDAHTSAVIKNTAALDKGSKKQTEAQKAAAAFANERERDLEAALANITAIHEQAQAMEDQIATYGLSKAAIDQLTISRLEEQQAVLRGFEGSETAVELLNQEIDARKRLMSATSRKEVLDANAKTAEQAVQEWTRRTEQLADDLTDALMRGFESGKGFAENFWSTMKNMAKTTILQPMIQPVMSQVAGGIQGLLGMGGPGGAAGSSGAGGLMGMASNLSSIYGAVAGGLTSTVAGAAASIGSTIGSSALTSFAAGMKGSTLAAGLAGPTTAGATGAMGIGAMAAQALPYIGLAVAAYSLLQGRFKGETRLGGQFGYAFDGVLHDNRAGTTRAGLPAGTHFMQGPSGGRGDDTAVKQAMDATVHTINAIFTGVGSQVALSGFWGGWETSSKGRGGVMAGGRLNTGAMFGEDGSGSVYSGKRLFEAHSTRSPDAETAMANFVQDLYQSTIQALQAASNELPKTLQDMIAGVNAESLTTEAAQGLIAQISAMVESVNQFNAAVSQMPFEYLRDLSFDASTAILAFAGGLDHLVAGQTAYYEAFYSEEEKLENLSRNLAGAFGELGVVMPDVSAGAKAARAEYRAMVEAIDYETEAGQRRYAMLMALAEPFAQLTAGMDELYGAAELANDSVRRAADIQRERLGLEGQLLQRQGNTAELRRRELDALDGSNHALQQQIWLLVDTAAAAEAASRARQRELDAMYAARTAAEQAGSHAMAALNRSVDSSRAALQTAFDAIAESLNTAINTSKSAVSTLETMAGRLSSTLATMRGQTDDVATRAWAQAQIAAARAAGMAPNTNEFEQALSIVAQPSEGLFATFEDYQADFLKTANDIYALGESTDKQLTVEQRTLATLEDQLTTARSQFEQEMDALDLLVETAQQQLDEARGEKDILLAIPEALAGIAAAIAALQVTAPAGYLVANPDVADSYAQGHGGNMTAAEYAAYHYAAYGAGEGRGNAGMGLSREQAYMVANPDVAAAFNTDGRANNMTLEEYARFHYGAFGALEGRSFAVGTNFVPYDMQAYIHQGERIIPAADNAELMARLSSPAQSNAVLSAAVQRLTAEVAGLRAEQKASQFAIAKNTGKSARNTEYLERWDMEGQPALREV